MYGYILDMLCTEYSVSCFTASFSCWWDSNSLFFSRLRRPYFPQMLPSTVKKMKLLITYPLLSVGQGEFAFFFSNYLHLHLFVDVKINPRSTRNSPSLFYECVERLESDPTWTHSPALWNAKNATVLPDLPTWDFQLPWRCWWNPEQRSYNTQHYTEHSSTLMMGQVCFWEHRHLFESWLLFSLYWVEM